MHGQQPNVPPGPGNVGKAYKEVFVCGNDILHRPAVLDSEIAVGMRGVVAGCPDRATTSDRRFAAKDSGVFAAPQPSNFGAVREPSLRDAVLRKPAPITDHCELKTDN